MSFNDKLSFLMDTFNIKSSALSKYLFVDPSLVSKWRTGKRKLPFNSENFDGICEFIANYSMSTLQKKKLCFILKLDTTDKLPDSHQLNIALHKWFTDNSINFDEFELTQPEIKGTFTFDNILYAFSSDNIIDTENYDIPEVTAQQDQFTLYEGIHGLLEALNNLIANISKLTPGQSLYLCLPGSYINLISNEFYLEKYCSMFSQLLERGQNIKLITNIDFNINYNNPAYIQIISLCKTGHFDIYCLPSGLDIEKKYTMGVVPGNGTFFCLPHHKPSQTILTFLSFDMRIVDCYKIYFEYLLSISHSIIYAITPKRINHILNLSESFFSKMEELNIFSDCLYISTMNPKLFERLLAKNKMDNLRSRKLYNALLTHHHFFIKNLSLFRHRFIIPLSSIDEMINSNGYSYPQTAYFTEKSLKASPYDVINHLQWLIMLLKQHPNLQIALPTDTTLSSFNQYRHKIWGFKSNSAAMILFLENRKGLNGFIIGEKNVFFPIEETFNNLWDSIPQNQVDTSSVIKTLKSRIDKLELLLDR